MRKQSFLLSLSLLFAACNSASPPENQLTAIHYFDLKGYIAKEADRLNTQHPIVDKTVMVNKTAERKQLKIADWNKEFTVFSDADINKSAWQGLFRVVKEKDMETYRSDDDKVPVKSLIVRRHNGKISSIEILMKISNLLYTSSDTLAYFPDSLYLIKKIQHIKLLEEKNYQITGRFH